jgi:cell division septation protein DedD
MTSASASRVTRSSRSLRLATLLFVGVLAGVTVLRAQETAPPPPAAASATPAQPAPAASEAAPPGEAPAQQAKPPPSPAASPARFEPTEKVRADFDVSFPIDI